MDVAYISDVAYPFVTGGAQRRIYDLGGALAERGHAVTLYTWTWWDGPRVVQRDGMRLVGLGRPPVLYRGDRRGVPEAVAFARRAAAALLRSRHDLVDASQFPYLHIIPCAVAARLRRTPLVVTWYEVWGRYWHEYLGALGVAGRAVEAACARLSEHNVAISPLAASRLKALGAADVRVIPPGIRLECYRPRARRTVDVVFVGRLIPEKGADLLLDALARLHRRGVDVSASVIGEGPQKPALRRRCRELDLDGHIEFRGFRPRHEEMLSELGSARVFACPSRREGFGMAVLEAMALGVPPLLVRAPLNASAGMVGDGGVVVEPTAAAYADALAAMLGDEVWRRALAQRARRRAEAYDLKKVVGRLEAYYETVVRGRNR